MSEKFPGKFPTEHKEKKEIIELKHLAERYKSERFIIDGIDKEARENNRLVVEAIEAAGTKLNSHCNDVFAINMGGSRIKGYNTKESDIDLVIVVPDTTINQTFIHDIIQKELQTRGITNHIDTMMGLWSEYEVETDPEQFVFQVDHHGNELITLFGYTPYCNPNMDLSRLAALEIINQYNLAYYVGWESVAENFAETYLGEHDHLVKKFSERYKLPVNEVAKIFTQTLLKERHQKFGLENPKQIYTKLKEWYSANKKNLRKFTMFKTYQGVQKLLREGF